MKVVADSSFKRGIKSCVNRLTICNLHGCPLQKFDVFSSIIYTLTPEELGAFRRVALGESGRTS